MSQNGEQAWNMTNTLKFKFIFSLSFFGGVETKINAECVQKMSINRFSHTHTQNEPKTDDELRAASAP